MDTLYIVVYVIGIPYIVVQYVVVGERGNHKMYCLSTKHTRLDLSARDGHGLFLHSE